MIPGGDHSSRTLLLRRVSSWSEVATTTTTTTATATTLTDNNNHHNNNNNNSNNNGVDDDDDDGNDHENMDNHNNHDDGANGGDEEHISILSSFDGDETSSLQFLGESASQPLLPSLEYEEESTSSHSHITTTGLMRSAILTRWRTRGVFRFHWKLWTVFLLLVLSGVGNVLLAKMSSYRLYNYPTFLNMYSNVIYTIMSFAYIIPVGRFGWFRTSIPRTHWSNLPKRPFAIMGCLDAMAATIQVLANVYLPGTLLVLIPQAAIPLSMIGSWFVLRERYSIRQYVGAGIVLMGIIVVLFPIFTHRREAHYYCRAIDEDNDCTVCQVETTEDGCLSHVKIVKSDEQHETVESLLLPFRSQQQQQQHDTYTNTTMRSVEDDDSRQHDETELYCTWISREEAMKDDDFLVFVWSILMLLSLVPMVMSTIYKQVALQVNLDPILVNGWVSFFQLGFGITLVVPAGLLSSPRVHPFEIGSNWKDGVQCLFARTNTVDGGCHPDDCGQAALWVHLGLISAIVYALSMMFVLKYGSCDLMYLGLTLVVPLAHLTFTLNARTQLDLFSVGGLVVSVTGLLMYRFGHEDPTAAAAAAEGDRVTFQMAGSDEHNGSYMPLSGGEDDDDRTGQDETPLDSPSPVPQQQSFRRDDVTTATTDDDKGGFLEFLREPFLLVGDI